MAKPECFGYWSLINEECQKNCSYEKQCRLFQETNLLSKYYTKYKLGKEVPDGLKIEDILDLDE